MKLTALFLANLICVLAYSQETDTASNELETVIVRAFEQSRSYKHVPAAVSHIGRSTLQRFNSFGIVQAVNTAPGIRMEERSPGSYRFNIRGSSLRSPFGVRNVKVYFNDIPFTDPGGHTYLNQLGNYNFNSIDIIKGPSASIYGAGTGGTMLIEAMNTNLNAKLNAFGEYTVGSYNTHNLFGRVTTGNIQQTQFSFQHQQSDGYRMHSELQRNVFTYTGNYQLSKAQLKTTFLYGDLKYQTPGALTESEYRNNARAARPGSSAFPGAEQARAGIMQKMFLAGASLNAYIGAGIANKTVLYGMFTDLRNPTIQNYGHNSEPHTGVRTVFTFKPRINNNELTLQLGTELQQGFATVSIHKNTNGNADSLRSTDNINTRQSLLFLQAAYESEGWVLTGGVGLNNLRIKFERFSPSTAGEQIRRFKNTIAPRIALLKKLNTVSAYASVSKGFSPPTTSELFPTGGAVNAELNAESGINYELGLKGTPIQKVFVDINLFRFDLKNTIVQRRTAGGGDYFINAGSTKQQGVETSLQIGLLSELPAIQRAVLWFSHTFHDFSYKEFRQINTDYSGNRLPSVPKHTISSGYDLQLKNGILGTVTYYYAGRIALNDANSSFADEYHLIGLRVGYQTEMKNSKRIKLTAGAENLLDEQYSLGNDINGFGGRYFNAAAGRNYYLSFSFEFRK